MKIYIYTILNLLSSFAHSFTIIFVYQSSLQLSILFGTRINLLDTVLFIGHL